MTYRHGTPLQQINIVLTANAGGMGDQIARMPAIKYIYKNHPQVRVYLFVYDYLLELYQRAFRGQENRIHIMPRSIKQDWMRDRGQYIPKIELDYFPKGTSASKPNLVEYGFNILEFRTPPKGEDWNYPKVNLLKVDVTRYNLPERYGVLSTGYTTPVREWPPEQAFEVADWMIQNNITPVYLGKSENALGVSDNITTNTLPNEAIHPQGLDLRDKTTVVEALKVMSTALFVAGPDSGLLHLACMSDVPTIWLFTSIAPEQRLPFRNGIQGWRTLTVGQPESLECRYCETNQNMVFNSKGETHNYKECFYKDYLCIQNLTAGKVISKIKQVTNYTGHGARSGN